MKRVIRCSSNIERNGKIQEGMYWSVDGHHMEVTSVDGRTCKISEGWIAEDSGRIMRDSATYDIVSDEDGVEYAVDQDYPKFRLCATAAFNYPYLDDDEEDIDDDVWDMYDYYTPSASRHDYGPSNPWDAPGMSVKDFI